MIWHDIRHPEDPELDRLAERYHLHPLHIEDCRHGGQRAKVEEGTDYLFVVLKPVKLAEIDPELKTKLKAEYPAILRWAIQGCLDWQQNGFVEPEVVRQATDDYLEEEDVRSQWLEERTVRDGGAFTLSAELFADWQGWAISRNHAVGGSTDFGRWLGKQGFATKKKTNRGFTGLRLKPEEKEPWDR